ncbi:hypothetical protein WJX72_001449 [[Myrmecia] bisecta]|uniref:Protein tyrosine phosphatase n=1 Tax=[Myrmecia] bisecta TaxID=41462 RepID=A0AAW1P7X7_9CHLO
MSGRSAPALEAARQQLMEKLDNQGQVCVYEFERLRRTNSSASLEAAELRTNETKNRYINVLPYDDNRVRLEGPSDYINASLLESREGEVPRWRYIAAQGPVPGTVADFWQMVMEQQCSVILMLTRCIENRSVLKCAEYFPVKVEAVELYGDFSVRLDHVEEIDSDICKRCMTLQDNVSGELRVIQHYHYHRWPDHGVPDSTAPLRRLAKELQASHPTASGPPLVHCSAGIGRTGTLCAIDIMLRRLRHLDPADMGGWHNAVNVKRIVLALRKQRMGMVQTVDQYIFCHQAIKEELDEVLGRKASSETTASVLRTSSLLADRVPSAMRT